MIDEPLLRSILATMGALEGPAPKLWEDCKHIARTLLQRYIEQDVPKIVAHRPVRPYTNVCLVASTDPLDVGVQLVASLPHLCGFQTTVEYHSACCEGLREEARGVKLDVVELIAENIIDELKSSIRLLFEQTLNNGNETDTASQEDKH